MKQETQPDVERLQQVLGLTPAEARVAALIATGQETNQIAASLNVQPNTVRMHIKSIYAKTGIKGRANLTRLVVTSP